MQSEHSGLRPNIRAVSLRFIQLLFIVEIFLKILLNGNSFIQLTRIAGCYLLGLESIVAQKTVEKNKFIENLLRKTVFFTSFS